MTITTSTNNIGSTVIEAIEGAWTAIVERHPELPAEIMVITGTGARSNGLVRGHWAAGRWHVEDGKLPEVFIAGERLADGARGVLTTLIHEAAHALADVRGIKETSRQHRYHNKKFKALAEEMGLTVTDAPDATIGFSMTYWNNGLEADYADEVKALEEAIVATIPDAMKQYMEWAAMVLGLLYFFGWDGGKGANVSGLLSGVKATKQRRKAEPKVSLVCDCTSVEVPASKAQVLNLHCNDCDADMVAMNKL